MKLTHEGMLKAIKILKTEKKYIHTDFQNKAGNCFCALGAVAYAHDAFQLTDGVITTAGWDARHAIAEHTRCTEKIRKLLIRLAQPYARVTRAVAVAGLQLIDRTYFKAN